MLFLINILYITFVLGVQTSFFDNLNRIQSYFINLLRVYYGSYQTKIE